MLASVPQSAFDISWIGSKMSAASSRLTGGVLLDRVVLLLVVVLVVLGLLRFTEKRDAMDIELIPIKCSCVPVFLCSSVPLFQQCSGVPKSNVRVLLCTRFKGYSKTRS